MIYRWHGETTQRCSSQRAGAKARKHDKASHDHIDSRIPGGAGSRCACCVRQLAAQRLRRPWSGKPGDPWLRTAERAPGRRRWLGRGSERVLIERREPHNSDWSGRRKLKRPRRSRRPGATWARRAGSGRDLAPSAGWGRAGIRRGCRRVSRLRTRRSPVNVWIPGVVRQGLPVHRPGGLHAGIHGDSHQAPDGNSHGERARVTASVPASLDSARGHVPLTGCHAGSD